MKTLQGSDCFKETLGLGQSPSLNSISLNLTADEVKWLCKSITCRMSADCDSINDVPIENAAAKWRDFAPRFIAHATDQTRYGLSQTCEWAERAYTENNRLADLLEKLVAELPFNDEVAHA